LREYQFDQEEFSFIGCAFWSLYLCLKEIKTKSQMTLNEEAFDILQQASCRKSDEHGTFDATVERKHQRCVYVGLKLTISSPRFAGKPESLSTTSFTLSGGFLCRSLTSRAKRASVRGGKFSEFTLPAEVYCRYTERAEETGEEDMKPMNRSMNGLLE
jgi:hypothetical protein